MEKHMTPADLDELEKRARAALEFQPEPPSDGWPDGEPETAPEWDATSGWLEDGGHAAFARNHEYSVDQESDGADVDAAYIKALPPEVTLALVAEVREARRLKSALEFLARDGDLFDLWREDDGIHAETPHGLHGVTAPNATDALLHHCHRRGWKEDT